MAITPTGAPAWARTNTHVTYGGNANKVNYLSRGVIDALTDVGAEDLCRLAADLEAIQRVAPFAVITFACNDTIPAPPAITYCLMMTGVRVTSYPGDVPPTGFPSAARNGNGDVTFTFAASYSDAYGVSAAWAPVSAHVSAGVRVISGATVRVSGLATNAASTTLTVW